MSYLKKVEEFNTTFDHPVLAKPEIPRSRIQLRINLLREELEELEAACDQDDIVETVDALSDLQYVLAGAILEFGFKDKFDAIFDEVHRSNMSKACKTEGEAKATVTHWEVKEGASAEYYQKGDVYLVRRVEDGKTLKSINYSKANIAPLCK